MTLDTTKNTLEQLGWSQENIALAIGVTRPTYKKHVATGAPLSMEAGAKLAVLTDMQTHQSQFMQEAVDEYTKRKIWSKAYQNLALELEKN